MFLFMEILPCFPTTCNHTGKTSTTLNYHLQEKKKGHLMLVEGRPLHGKVSITYTDTNKTSAFLILEITLKIGSSFL